MGWRSVGGLTALAQLAGLRGKDGREVGKGRGVQRHSRRRKMRHRNPRRDKNKEVWGTKFKFDQLIFRKIIKIVAIRCRILRLKCTKFDFGWAPPQTPLGELTVLPPNP